MNKIKIIIFFFIFFILILSFSIYFLLHDSNKVENTYITEPIAKIQLPSPAPSPILEEIVSTERKPLSEKVSNPEIRRTDEIVNHQVEKIKEEVIPVSEAKPDLYQPFYDRLIVRSRAKAFFQLHDAKGKLLEPKIVNKIRIWRQIRDDLWLEDNAVFNHEKSLIECDGFGRQGLEPGRFFVWVDGGGYGTLEFNFQINKDEEYQANFQMPNYTKIIALHFVDFADKNVDYIRSLPSYKSEENKEPIFKFHSKDILVLKASPAENIRNRISSSGGGGGGGSFGSRSGRPDLAYATNMGKMYIRVFAGQQGEIKYEYNNEGQAFPFFFKNNFEDVEIVKVPVKLPTQLGPKTKIITFDESQNNESMGFNVNKIASVKKEDMPINVDYNTKGVNYRLKKSKFPLQLEIQNTIGVTKTIKDDGYVFQYIFGQTEIEDTINIRLVDKKVFRSPWEPITLEKGRMIYKEGEFPLQKFQVKFKLSPTFFEMSKDFAEVSFSDNSFALEYSNSNLLFESYFIEDSPLFNENVSDLNFNIISKISNFRTSTRDSQYSSRFLPRGFIYKTDKDALYQVPLKINTMEVIKSYDKTIECAPLENVLILRAVDLSVSGLPWVEASLINYEDRGIALEVKKNMSDSVNLDYIKSLTDIDLNVKSESELNGLIAKKLNQIFPLKEQLNYFLANGTWYNPKARSFSDSAGYMILKTNELIPGKTYSLFLWCRSKDELTPDKEIIFKAEEGITDLGAIRFY